MAQHPHRVRTAFAVQALVLALSACGAGAPAEDAPPPAGPVPPGLERFYGQQLTFEACPPYATTDADAAALAADERFECARLEVPMDYEEPDGPTASVALLRVPARGEAIGSLLLNPGGPGTSGMSFAATVAGTLAEDEVTERFDLVGFDPRGVAASTPALDCFTDAERDADVTLSTLSAGVEDWTEDQTAELYRQCAERSGGEDVLASVGTRDVVRDMDVLRAVLGDEQLSYAGGSYGTRLGAVYAETFPDNVRAMVLDGAVDPGTGTAERRIDQFEGFQRSFDNLAAACAEDPACPLGTDPEQATTRFQQLVQPLVDEPAPAADGRELSYSAAVDGTLSALYSEETWPVLVKGLTELAAGRGDTMVALRNFSYHRNADGSYGNSLEALLAIDCLDEERHTPEQESAMKRELFEVAPFMDTGRPVEARNACEQWPVEPTLGYPYAADVEGLPPTLVVSVTRDPATPYEGAASLAEALGGSLLTVEGEQHGIALVGGNRCVDDHVAAYLVDLTVPPADARCTI